MAKYEITAPDGGRYEIEAPDNMPDSQVADMVRKQFSPSEKPLNWSDVPGQALANAPASAANLAGSVFHAVTNPVETVGNLADVAAGGLRAGAKRLLPTSVFNAIDNMTDQDTRQRISDKASATGEFLADRYGGSEALKKTLATDPVGAMADAATVLTGGGAIASRAPGIIGRMGEAASAAGSAIDPIMMAGRAVGRAGSAAADVLGVTTGAGTRPFREAYQAGRTGNQTFVENMRGLRPIDDVVDMAEAGVAEMGKERSVAYTAGMAGVNGNQSVVHLTPVFKALKDASDEVHFQGVVKDQAAASVVKAMQDKVHEFARIPGPGNPARFDAMKQAIGEIYNRTQPHTMEQRVAGKVYNTIKSEISRQVPKYADTMRDYANASDAINEMRRTMSVSNRAMPDTTLRKLQSTMRNNVNTNYGARERLLDTLAQHQPNLPPALAGQSLNTIAPRGLARISPMSLAASGFASFNPATIAALPLTSPRLMGELAHGVGQASGAIGRLPGANRMSLEGVAQAVRAAYAADTADKAQKKKKDKRTKANANAGRGLIGLGNATR